LAEKSGPISILAHRLRSLGRPPSLSTLAAIFNDAEEYKYFVSLVREFLPEREDDILQQCTPSAQMAAFASHFRDRYFPLADYSGWGEMEEYSELTRGIPVVIMGITYEDYHYLPNDGRPGYQLIAYLLAGPSCIDEEVRIALAEACAEHVPREQLLRVPEGGLPREEAHRLLDDSPYRAVAMWADVLDWATGNFFLDTNDEDLSYNGLPDWNMETVMALTEQWQRAEVIDDAISDFVVWLEEDMASRFQEIFDFIEEKRNQTA